MPVDASSLSLSSADLPFERGSSILVIIDLQEGHLGAIRTIAPQQLRKNVGLLAQIVRLYDLPVVFTGSKQPPPEGTFLPEATSPFPDVQVIERTTVNAWDTPEFVSAIEETGRRHLIVAGVALEIGVMFPVLSAISLGYTVSVVVDATGTTDARIEVGAMSQLASAGVALPSVASVGMKLQSDLSLPKGQELMTLLRSVSSPGRSPFGSGG